MSWKNVNLFRLKSLSLVTKLMLLYSLSTIGLLSAICLFLYPTFIKIINQISGKQAISITYECYKKMIITLLFSSLVAIIFGHIIARKGLKRMRAFENKMQEITVDSLHERIALDEWPKELKNFCNKFNMMLDRIQTSFIQLSQFSSDIAHELRTPINNLRGITEIALSKEKYNNEYQEILEYYMSEYQYLSKLIENLLFLARSDYRQLTLRKETINVKKTILNICDYYQAIADENKVKMTCSGEAYITVDLTLFKRVISNLLSNALKFTKSNGKIAIFIKPHDQHIEISMHDTGIGISETHINRVFDRFYKIDSSRSSQSGGLGLGLAIVKSVMNLHNAQISIKSKLNLGTSIYLLLPITT